MKSAQSNISILKQVCQLIPANIITKLAKKHGVDKQSRSISPEDHIIALIFSQLTHAISLNDVCDNLQNHAGQLKTIRGAKPLSRNGFSYANRNRNADMAEDLFWETLNYLQEISPGFAGKNYQCFPKRFKKTINVIDSTVISLVASCMDWAKHTRQKAAAKCHMCLDLSSFLPKFAIVNEAKHSDSKMAYELCANLKAGEIAIFDRAYVDFGHLNLLDEREISWVSRTKNNMQYTVVEKNESKNSKIVSDEIIVLSAEKTKNKFDKKFRRVCALVEVNGKEVEMSFITNNLKWAAKSVCELYKSRWAIEVFFKQIKQTLKLCDFLGHNENAVKWQIWIALLLYVLLRFLSYQNKWEHSFSRLFTLVRGVLWSNLNLIRLLESYGTASEKKRLVPDSRQLLLPGIT